MDYKPWLKNLTIENLPYEDLKIVATTLGLDIAIKLMCELSGMFISVPQNAFKKAKWEYIRQNYYGSNMFRYELEKTCLVSENYIYKIVKKIYKK